MAETGIRYDEIAPPPALAAHVRCLWHLRGRVNSGAVPEPIVPDGCVELLLNLADPFVRYMGDGNDHVQPLRLVAGQLTRAITIEPSGRVDLWGVRFQPWAAARFLGVSGDELRDRFVPLDDTSSSLDSRLAAVGEAATGAARERALVDALAHRARAVGPSEPVLPALVSYIARSREPMSVRGVARHAGLSVRRVQALFAERVGLSPKALMRINRFQRALHLARERSGLSWGAVAAHAGYYDQAHLIHECHDIAGCTPSTLVAKQAGLTEMFLSG